MGLLSTKFHATFTVADFVSSFSSAPVEALPSSSIHLFPLLLLSLVTSTFGFSLGPEGERYIKKNPCMYFAAQEDLYFSSFSILQPPWYVRAL
jgi:hypothetical protein